MRRPLPAKTAQLHHERIRAPDKPEAARWARAQASTFRITLGKAAARIPLSSSQTNPSGAAACRGAAPTKTVRLKAKWVKI
jgi:hypothetical protein